MGGERGQGLAHDEAASHEGKPGTGLKATVLAVISGVLLVVPWLNPMAGGPSPSVIPWLTAAACGLLLCLNPVPIRADLIAKAVTVAALISAFIAVMQYFGLAHWLVPWVNDPGAGQAYGNLRQRNQFASLTSMGLVGVLYLSRGSQTRTWSLGLVVLLAVAAACSASRTGFLQWFLIWLCVLAWSRAPRAPLTVLAGAGLATLVVASIALPHILRATNGIGGALGVLDRIATKSEGCEGRLTLWSNVLHLVGQKPWIGWGWGELDYAHFITLYPNERFCDILDNAHNLPLHLAVELGVPVAALCCALLALLLCLGRPWRESVPARQLAWAWLALMAIHSLLEYPLWYGPFQIVALWCVWFLSTQAAATESERREFARQRPLPAHRRAAMWAVGAGRLTAVLGLAVCGYAAWDYHRISQIYLPTSQRSPAYRSDTLSKIRGSVLFRSQVQFAELATVPLSRANSQYMHDLALELLHFSPEARVAERLIESSILLGRQDEARFYLERYRKAFPKEHARWASELALGQAHKPSTLASQ